MLASRNRCCLATVRSPPEQFLMSYWGIYISRFMGVCHSNEGKLGLKKTQE